MKKIYMLLFFFMSFIFISNVKAIELDINSNHALLYNLNDDTILYEKNSEERTSIASITKIMTSIIVIENVENLDSKVTLTYDDFYGLAEANAAQAGFYAGEVVTYRDLLYGLMLPSGADAAQALTRNVSGSRDAFIDLMNKKAKELGMNNTHFVNETGLDDVNHYSNLKDVAIMFKYALKNNVFNEIIRTKSYTTSDYQLTFYSTTRKASSLNMGYLIGGKTGTTDDAGLCLASIANYNGVDYMLITTRAPWDRNNPLNFLDAKTIYEYFMNNFSYKNVLNKNDVVLTLDTQYAKKNHIKFKGDKLVDMYLSNDYKKDDLVYKYNGEELITLDMPIGTKLGKVDVYYGDEILTSVDIILDEKLELDLGKYLNAHKREVVIVLLTVILFILLVISAVINKVKLGKIKRGKN